MFCDHLCSFCSTDVQAYPGTFYTIFNQWHRSFKFRPVCCPLMVESILGGQNFVGFFTTFLPLFTPSITSFISNKLPACSAFFSILNYSGHSFFPWQEDQLGIPVSQIKPLNSTNWARFNNWTTLIKTCSYGNRSYWLSTLAKTELLYPKNAGHRLQWISNKMNIRHPGQLKKSKSWGPFWSYQLNSTANLANLAQFWGKWAGLAVLFSW